MINSKLKLKWVVQCRVTLEYETMVLMKNAGCRLVVVGYESGSQKVLDGMNKGITLEQSLKFNEAAKKAKMRVHGCFMVGNPGETKKTMNETLEFSKKLRMDTVQYFPLIVYPGTEAWTWAKQNNFITAKYRESALGPKRKYFSITLAGEKELEAFINNWQELNHAVNQLFYVGE
jgi:radical SAM superfamily enzyme YgiQ (UPF0313 family)